MAEKSESILRDQLATATRMMVMANLMDYSGHLSARVPGTDRVLIQPRDASRAGLRAEEVLVVDMDGKVIEGDVPAPPETPLHLGVYRAREDVFAVAHAHPPFSIMFTMVDMPMIAMRNFGYRFVNCPVHPDTTHIRTLAQGAEVAATLGTGHYCLLRAHGSVIARETVPEIFLDSLEMEENAKTIVLAAALGTPNPITAAESELLGPSFNINTYRTPKVWEHYKEMAHRKGVL
jgi:L-ribulose-5-phosphate 4-epimerase